jgi:hypothetical protein
VYPVRYELGFYMHTAFVWDTNRNKQSGTFILDGRRMLYLEARKQPADISARMCRSNELSY